ncbi:MAG: HD domain-containing protein [Bacteroidota bacterium]
MVKAFSTNLPLPDTYLKQLEQTQQNPVYHGEGDVLAHTLMVLENVLALDASWDLSQEERKILYWAAVLHDIGKPATTLWEDGRYHSHGHEAAGVPIARNILLQQPDINDQERAKILELVRWHSVPLQLGLRGEKIESYFPWAVHLDIRLLGIFAFCDLTGRICRNQSQVFDLIMHFNEAIVGEIEERLGSYSQIQDLYASVSLSQKNELWKALRFRDTRLLESMLNEKDRLDKQMENLVSSCIIPIGVSDRSMQAHLDQYYPDALHILVERKAHVDISHEIFRQLEKGQSLVFGGDFTEVKLLRELTEVLRAEKMEVYYLFFEESQESILQDVRDPFVYTAIRKRYERLEQPHPWAAHHIQYHRS